jgi:hypothetical protein
MANQISRSFQQIWKGMDHERRVQAATAFYSKENVSEQRRLAGVIAMKLNLRPQKAAKLPAEKAGGYLASILSVDEPTAALLVRSYLFGCQQPMLLMFLDDLKVPHKDGVIGDGVTEVPTADALQSAVVHIRGSFASEDVNIYLSALAVSDTGTWKNLPEALGQEQK